MQPRIMYIENKSNGRVSSARIGLVRFSQTGATLYYCGKTFKSLKGSGVKGNYYDVDTGEEYWISGCKKRGGDRLYPGVVDIDDDIREEYWSAIRGQPDMKDHAQIKDSGKYS